MDTATEFFALLTVAANLFVAVAVVSWFAARVSPSAARGRRDAVAWLRPAALPLAWTVAATATAGSLAYSQIARYTPCTLCWYQRIGMYPLVIVLAVAAWRRDDGIRWYVLPVVAGGAAISVYHYLLQRFPTSSGFCEASAPCTLTWVWKYHYISIPFMALSAFTLIATLMLLARAPADAVAGEASVHEMTGALR